MQYEPHDYQRKALTHLLIHKNAVLLLDMGLGKTVITLTALQALLKNGLTHRALVIAPKRVASSTWPSEIAKWDHLADLDAVMLTGTPTQRKALAASSAPLHIINRELVPWLVQHHTKCGWPYDTVIIDELSSFKTHNSQRNKALMKVRSRINRMIGLTGTPTSNGLLDLFGQYKVIDPSIFGTRITAYREQYFKPAKYVYGRPVDWQIKPGASEEIYEKIRPVTLSMTAKDFLDVPPVVYADYPVAMPNQATASYQALKRDLVADIAGQSIDAGSAATLAGKLLQLANGAIYTGEGQWRKVHVAKLDALEDIVESANGQSLLVAYWFKHDLARICERFPQARLLDKERDFAQWNAGRIPLGLIHPASAGHGLNLQSGGHLIVWFSLTWSLELYQQLNGRLHRQGQTRPVTVTHLITEGTIDRKVLTALQRKDFSQGALIDAVKAELKQEGAR
jgi:SNF2 family DNA or RNA helicase|nr:MAG TPA: Chromatin remodeling complex ATPase [Caudoviricetes sp.]